MKNTQLITCILLFITAIAVSCKKSDSSSNNNGTAFMQTVRDTMAATVNSNVWISFNHSFSLFTLGSNGTLVLEGTDSSGAKTIGIYINDYTTGARTYTIAGTGTDTASYTNLGVLHHVSSGTLQVVAVSDSFVQGKFTLTADSFSIINGVFNYKQ